MSHDNALDREQRADIQAAYHNALFNMRGLSMPEMVIYLEAVCVSVIREFFRQDPVFTWEDDEDLSLNNIWVGTEYPRNRENVPDLRPKIVVGMRGLSSNKVALRNIMKQDALDPKKAHQNSEKVDVATIPMQISVLSPNRDASLFLACNMHALFRTHAEYIQAAFQLNSITAPATGAPAIAKDYPDHFITPVTFSIEVLPKWTQIISEETFKSVVLNIRGIVEKSLLAIVEQLKPDQYVEQGLSLTDE